MLLWFGRARRRRYGAMASAPPLTCAEIAEHSEPVLSVRYPTREITVEVTGDEDGSYGPTVTFWSEPGSLRSGEVAAALGG